MLDLNSYSDFKKKNWEPEKTVKNAVQILETSLQNIKANSNENMQNEIDIFQCLVSFCK